MGIKSSFFVLKLLQLRLCKGPESRTQGALRTKKCAFARNPHAPVRTSDSAWCVLTPEMRKAPDVNCLAVLGWPMKSNPIACCLTALMSLLCICWYAINTWHKVVAIDGLPTHVHRPYVLSCFLREHSRKKQSKDTCKLYLHPHHICPWTDD